MKILNKIWAVCKTEKFLLFALFVLVFLSRVFYLGTSLWHDDAFNFVDKAINLAINGQYISAHSSGYPLWLLILALGLKIGHHLTGQWMLVFIPNFIVVIFGSLLVFPIFILAKRLLANYYYAFLATIVVLLNPVIWRWSTVAMSDIPALFFALLAIVYFLYYLDKTKSRDLFFSNLWLFMAMMIRPQYGLLFLIFLIFSLINFKFDIKRILPVGLSWVLAVLGLVIGYAAFNDWHWFYFGNTYGSFFPNAGEVLTTLLILSKSIGLFWVILFLLGAFYLFKKDRRHFYYYNLLWLISGLYLASTFRLRHFDIERYGLLVTIFLLLIASYVLKINKFTRAAFLAAAVISCLILWRGLVLPVNFYNVYLHDANFFKDYKLKAQQLAEQRLEDGDLSNYQDLATILRDQDVVFHIGIDWSMPKLLLAGAHLPQHPTLVPIDDENQLKQALEKYKGHRLYLLRGVYEMYEAMPESKDRPVADVILYGRSRIHVLSNK
ncbi:MAG: hypothetical protein WC465_04770 [Patescibacteria group bacterium]